MNKVQARPHLFLDASVFYINLVIFVSQHCLPAVLTYVHNLTQPIRTHCMQHGETSFWVGLEQSQHQSHQIYGEKNWIKKLDSEIITVRSALYELMFM